MGIRGSHRRDREWRHFRREPRRQLEAVARLEIRLPDGRVFDRGRARLRDVSPGGALLVDVRTRLGSFPIGPFTLHLVLEGEEFAGVAVDCSPLRLEPERRGIAVRLGDFSTVEQSREDHRPARRRSSRDLSRRR
jgi:hypothetical protein